MSERQRAAAIRGAAVSSPCLVQAKTAFESNRGSFRHKRAFKNGGGSGGSGGSGGPRGRETHNTPPPVDPPPRPVPERPGPPHIDPTPQPVLQEFFPWPPPAPSDRRMLQLARLGGGPPPHTWGEVADRIVARLQGGGFKKVGFYSAPGGFAVIPPVEQLDISTGAALAEDQRWAAEIKLASTSILDGIFTVRRPKGLYRVFAFVLTTDPRSGGAVTDPRRMLQIAQQWANSSATDLPQAMRIQAINDAQRLFVLVYEFESAVGGETKVNSPGRWQLERHFSDAGIDLGP
jgi:hypothetical protein